MAIKKIIIIIIIINTVSTVPATGSVRSGPPVPAPNAGTIGQQSWPICIIMAPARE